MSNTLIPVKPNMTLEEFHSLASSKKFLPRVQLFGSASKLCKMGKFPIGHYGLVTGADKADDLGESLDMLVINVRAKALDTTLDPPVSVFDRKHPEFQRIVDATEKPNSGCMWGPEYLVWLPMLKIYATFFFLNATMRREAANMHKLLGSAATAKVQFIESKSYGGWHGPLIVPCTTPFDLPEMEDLEKQVDTFTTPPALQVETVEESDTEERAR